MRFLYRSLFNFRVSWNRSVCEGGVSRSSGNSHATFPHACVPGHSHVFRARTKNSLQTGVPCAARPRFCHTFSLSVAFTRERCARANNPRIPQPGVPCAARLRISHAFSLSDPYVWTWWKPWNSFAFYIVSSRCITRRMKSAQ